MRILAVIPARAGSVRLPRKNALEIEPGCTLVEQAVRCALHAGVITDVCVASDDPELIPAAAAAVYLPPHLAGGAVDIAATVEHATTAIEMRHGVRFDYVVTLQPAVLARSPLIVRRLVERVTGDQLGGGVTAARTVPWQWQVRDDTARNAWWPGPYPRSQDSAHHLCEINAAQIATRAIIAGRARWGLPLVLAELPPWAAALDIDHPADLTLARDLWPWARPRLETWEPPMHLVVAINPSAAA